MRGFGDYVEDEKASTVKERDHKDATDLVLAVRTANTNANGIGVQRDASYTLDCGDGQAIMKGMQVRRLTPVECERLMGWPDDHTKYGADGELMADSTRYRMCGNGVVANVAEWLGSQVLKAFDQ